jgi:hypothetical protein
VKANLVHYFDKGYFKGLLKISNQSLDYLNSFVLLNLYNVKVKLDHLAKIPVNTYILQDDTSLHISDLTRYIYITGLSVEDEFDGDSDDIFVYSFYLILFDLDLNRLALFIDRMLESMLTYCMEYFIFISLSYLNFISGQTTTVHNRV